MSLNQFICCHFPPHSYSDDFHYIIEHPIRLECSHFICQNCFDQQCLQNLDYVICGECAHKYKYFYSLLDKNRKDSLNAHLDKLKNYIETRYNKALSDIKEKCEFFCAKIEYLKEEIDIQVESIKIDLDKHAEKLKHELDMIRDDVLSENFINKDYSKNLNLNDNESCHADSIKHLDILQQQIYRIKTDIKKMKDKIHSYELSENSKSVQPLLRSKFTEIIVKNEQNTPKFCMRSINDFCLLNDDELLFCVITNNSIEIYNKSYENVDRREIDWWFMDKLEQVICDDKNFYLITSGSDQYILKLNKKLKYLKKEEIFNYNFVESSHYYNKHIYLIYDDKLTKWTNKLEIDETNELDELDDAGNCVFIENMLCITYYGIVYFYTIEPFELKRKYNIGLEYIDFCFNIEENFFIKKTPCYEESDEEIYEFFLLNNEGKPIVSIEISETLNCIPPVRSSIKKRLEYNKKTYMAIRENFEADSFVFIII